MLLGAIIKEMDKAGLNIIAFKAPFDGFSVHAVLHSIYSFQDHRWYDSNEGHCLHPCDLRNEIKLGRKPTHDDYENFRSACLHDNSSYGNHSLCTLFNVVETALDKNEGDMYMNIADFSTYYHVKQKPVATGFGGYGGFGS